MSPIIEAEIEKFEALQARFADLGAEDSDSDAIFQMLIAHAINLDPVDIDKPIDWDLYEHDEYESPELRISARTFELAKREMDAQGWIVYRAIQAHATKADVAALKKYCWRLDPEEFEPLRK